MDHVLSSVTLLFTLLGFNIPIFSDEAGKEEIFIHGQDYE